MPLRSLRSRSSPWLALLALLAGPSSLAAEADEAAAGSARLIAIGDIHGEFEGLVSILRETGLIDERNHWVGGNATLVQTGDFTDRGPDVKRVIELLIRLEREAPQQGGNVVVLMGNHESMNLIGDFQDATEKMLSSFASPDSDKLREKAWKQWVGWLSQLARSRGGSPPRLDKERKAQWMKEHPVGLLEYQEAIGPGGVYGEWLLERSVMAKIGDTIYMHAGIGPEYADMSIAEINDLHRREIETFFENRRALVAAGLIPPFFNVYEINQALVYQSTNPPIEQYQNPAHAQLVAKAATDLNRMQRILLEDSPLWYRGFTALADEELALHLDHLKETYGAHRFVVAHSPMDTGSIRQRLGGRVFLIDTGMLQSYYRGRASALEVANGRFSAVYVDERQVLLDTMEDVLPASAAASDSASLSDSSVRPAIYHPGDSVRMLTAISPAAAGTDAAAPKRVWRGPDGKPLPFTTPEEAEGFLRTATVVSQEDIPKGITKPKKILLERGSVRAHAKFNYVDRKGQREKLADGTVEMYFLDSFKADKAAYELSRLLQMDNVPPGVIRNIDGQEGIVQLWIENLTTYENWLEQGNTGSPPSLYLQRQVTDMRVFDLLIRNTDRNQGNIVWNADNHLWLIDHTRSLARDPNLRGAEKLRGCSRGLYRAIRDLDESQVQTRLKPYLSSFEIKALFKRRVKLLKLLEAEIKKRGEGEVLFDYGDPPKGMVIKYDESAA